MTKKLSQMSDDELQGLVNISRLIGNDPRDVLVEMGRRVAREVFLKARAERAAQASTRSRVVTASNP